MNGASNRSSFKFMKPPIKPMDVSSSSQSDPSKGILIKERQLTILSDELYLKQKCMAIVTERHQRFNNLLVNKDQYRYSAPKRFEIKCKLRGVEFAIPLSIRRCKEVKGEPTIWFIKTLLPGFPSTVQQVVGEWEHRSKWDKKTARQSVKELFRDDTEKLTITNTLTNKTFGGILSPRQFTNVVHSKWTDADTLEVVASSVKHESFPKEKKHVVGQTVMCGHRITKLSEQKLRTKYGIPKISMSGDQGVLEWSKCDCMFQTHLKGPIPKGLIEKGVPGAIMETLGCARNYIFRDVLGFKIQS